jgi:integrase
VTFRECAAAFIAAHQAGWRNEVHHGQWVRSLNVLAAPLRSMAVADITTEHVLATLQPLWTATPETASRVRGRIEAVLDFAEVRGFREGENPARWRGHLDHLLPARAKVRPVVHHAALPYAGLPALMARLGEGVAARALAFTCLTAARSGETRHATWDEIDLELRVWTVPAERMKSGREHRVPLSDPALAILAPLSVLAGARQGLVFPGSRAGRPLGHSAMATELSRIGLGDATVHGLRSSFRDWAAETTGFPSEVVEMALAHAVGSKVEAAYRRGDLFVKRRQLMDAWAEFLARRVGENVVAIASR